MAEAREKFKEDEREFQLHYQERARRLLDAQPRDPMAYDEERTQSGGDTSSSHPVSARSTNTRSSDSLGGFTTQRSYASKERKQAGIDYGNAALQGDAPGSASTARAAGAQRGGGRANGARGRPALPGAASTSTRDTFAINAVNGQPSKNMPAGRRAASDAARKNAQNEARDSQGELSTADDNEDFETSQPGSRNRSQAIRMTSYSDSMESVPMDDGEGYEEAEDVDAVQDDVDGETSRVRKPAPGKRLPAQSRVSKKPGDEAASTQQRRSNVGKEANRGQPSTVRQKNRSIPPNGRRSENDGVGEETSPRKSRSFRQTPESEVGEEDVGLAEYHSPNDPDYDSEDEQLEDEYNDVEEAEFAEDGEFGARRLPVRKMQPKRQTMPSKAQAGTRGAGMSVGSPKDMAADQRPSSKQVRWGNVEDEVDGDEAERNDGSTDMDLDEDLDEDMLDQTEQQGTMDSLSIGSRKIVMEVADASPVEHPPANTISGSSLAELMICHDDLVGFTMAEVQRLMAQGAILPTFLNTAAEHFDVDIVSLKKNMDKVCLGGNWSNYGVTWGCSMKSPLDLYFEPSSTPPIIRGTF